MINLKGLRNSHKLHKEIRRQGYNISNDNGALSSDNDIAVQAIIDSFDPLPESKADAINLVNIAAGETREKYGTNIPFQDATYQMKEKQARQYKADGYPADATPYPFINMEAQATGSTPTLITDMVIALSDQWVMLAAAVEGLRRGGITAINNETNWNNCSVLAEQYVAQLKAL